MSKGAGLTAGPYSWPATPAAGQKARAPTLGGAPTLAAVCSVLLLAFAGSGAAFGVTIDSLTVGDSALTVKWSFGAGIDPVTSADLRYIQTDADETVDANWTVVTGIWSSGAREYLLTGLRNEVGYDVQVRSVRSSAGTWSATSAATPADPGSTRQTATTLPLDTVVGGNIGTGDDVDFFQITVTGSPGLLVYTTGALDTVGELQNSTGTKVAENDDGDLPPGSRNFAVTASASAGTYYVKVESYGDDDTGVYAIRALAITDTTGTSDAQDLAVGSSALGIVGSSGDDDYFKVTLSESAVLFAWTWGGVEDTDGELLDSGGSRLVQNDDGYLQSGERAVLLRSNLAAGTYYVKVGAWGDATGPYRVFLAESEEPGSTRAAAEALPLGYIKGGTIDPTGDVDYFEIDLDSATRVFIRAVSASVNIDGALQDSAGNAVSTNLYEQTFGSTSPIGFTIYDELASGTHYVKVSRSGGSTTGAYSILAVADPAQQKLLSDCSGGSTGFDDAQFSCAWHLKNTGQLGGTSGEDIDVESVWDDGNKGAGIAVAVVDNGLDYRHEDLSDNVDLTRNHDYSTKGDVFDLFENHGTSVAGVVAARDNDVGGRGVAPRATIFGYRLLGFTTDANEADAMTRGALTTAVSNNSWGPEDLPGLSTAPAVWETAIDTGVTTGDSGRGVFYAWAAGNGHTYGDYSNLDEYANYYGVTAVCAVSARGQRSWYSEWGSNLWVCAPSSDDAPGIFTTDNFSRYTARFGGTSAAAPVISGVAALIRQSRSGLSWRDVKLILAGSARKVDATDIGWSTGAARYGASGNYEFNHEYGFGVVDAEAAVELASGWRTLPALVTSTPVSTSPGRTIGDAPTNGDGSTVTTTVTVASDIDFIEFVEVNANFDAPAFRDLQVELHSPTGAVSRLSVPLYHAETRYGLNGSFRFGSARHLGEAASGEWSLQVRDRVNGGDEGTLTSWSLTLYGHKTRRAGPGPGGPGGGSSLPGAPTIDSVLPGSAALTVAWSAPASTGGSAIASYDLRLIRASSTNREDDDWTVLTGLSAAEPLRTTVSGLAGSTSYDLELRAVNAAGAGPWSATATGRTDAAGSPPPSGPPDASFTVSAECAGGLCRALTGEAVTFTDTSAGVVRSRVWSFGDGRTSRSAAARRSWSSPGFYTVTLTVGDGTVESTATRVFLVEAAEPAGTCVADETTRCLRDSRYAVRAEWSTGGAEPQTGAARVVRLGTNESGLFQFFEPENWEILIKVLDGCSINGSVWVFGASSTDLGYRIEVTDTATGEVQEYRNEPGAPAPAVTDLRAFPGSCAAAE